ncbi:MAG: ribulokinase [Cyclobacteriaceae bacterium]|nr:ribulokinase [Cyclobacteriaceae bacterium HetDA_MAG_MS6]
MTSDQFVIGLDFGTDSVRAVLIAADSGKTISSAVHWYERWKAGMYCDPVINQFRQHPLDHIEGMEQTIGQILKQSQVNPRQVKGICIDTTGSSPVAVDSSGIPLCMSEGFEENPNAMVILWKDHTSTAEADEINHQARNWGGDDYTKFVGGIYSSEWFWAKILHIIRDDQSVRRHAHSWMEHCDLMTYILVGKNDLAQFKRSRCAAGHKAMWHPSWGGLPPEQFLQQLDPDLASLRSRLYQDTFTSDTVAGTLNAEWSERLGLTQETIVSVGTFDAHAGAVGAEAEEFTLVRVMGTSTCDIIVSSESAIEQKPVKGICGQVDGSVIPGMIGLEAGQSAFGDVLAWFSDLLSWPIRNIDSLDLPDEFVQDIKEKTIVELSKQAEQTAASESTPIALDWVNGRRTPDANQYLKAAIANLSLGTQPPHIFRALVEAISFGSKRIVDRFSLEGVEIKKIVGIGGVAKKSAFIMQTLANVLNMPISIAVSEQAPALGSAMYAATAAGLYPNVREASKSMGNGFETTYSPQPDQVEKYEKLYQNYLSLGSFIEEKFTNKQL